VGEIATQASLTVPNTNVLAGLTSPWPDSVSPLVFSVRIKESPDNTTDVSGDLKITVTVDDLVTDAFVPLFDPAN
jgi:hypothetical protein